MEQDPNKTGNLTIAIPNPAILESDLPNTKIVYKYVCNESETFEKTLTLKGHLNFLLKANLIYRKFFTPEAAGVEPLYPNPVTKGCNEEFGVYKPHEIVSLEDTSDNASVDSDEALAKFYYGVWLNQF